jgi:hypothetical protein
MSTTTRVKSTRPLVKDVNGIAYMVVTGETTTSAGCFSPSAGTPYSYGSTNVYKPILLKDPFSEERTSFVQCTAGLHSAGTTDFGKAGGTDDAYVFNVSLSHATFHAITHGLNASIKFGEKTDIVYWFQINIAKKGSTTTCFVQTTKGKTPITLNDLVEVCGQPLMCDVLLNIKIGVNKSGGDPFFSATMRSCCIVKKWVGPAPNIQAMHKSKVESPAPEVNYTGTMSTEVLDLMKALKITK